MAIGEEAKGAGFSSGEDVNELIVQALVEKQGVDIVCIDLKSVHHVFFDYFIICTGNSKNHIETLCDFVQERTRRLANLRPVHVEGLENGEWVLLDYFNILVHIFCPEARKYYNIEALWSDADIREF